MIIKKFQGKTKEEALACARKELGDSIVEMNVKTIKPKGLLSFFKGNKIEVTVAKEEENEKFTEDSGTGTDGVKISLSNQGKIIPMKQSEKDTDSRPGNNMADAKNVGQAVAEVLASFPSQRADVSRRDTAPKAKEVKPPTQADSIINAKAEERARESTMDNLKGNGLAEKLDTLQSLIEKQLSQQRDGKLPAEESRQEPEERKEENKERVNFLRLLYNKMIDNEMNERYVNEIIDEIDRVCKADVTMDYMLSEIYQRMILKLGKPYIIEDSDEKPKVIFFVGPTGVGKTTTIAKIASSFRIEHKKKVALLTADTYRIAAAEQLRTYANILEVPFRVVYTAKEVISAVNDFNDYDYILVDTTGHSPNNEAQCESMVDLINSVDTTVPKEVFLVLSASTKYKDLMKISDTYREIADYKLIFTKLDETSTVGNIYNLKMYTGASLSYITCGQNVPDDIEYFNPQSTVKQLLGGRI